MLAEVIIEPLFAEGFLDTLHTKTDPGRAGDRRLLRGREAGLLQDHPAKENGREDGRTQPLESPEHRCNVLVFAADVESVCKVLESDMALLEQLLRCGAQAGGRDRRTRQVPAGRPGHASLGGPTVSQLAQVLVVAKVLYPD